MTGNMKKRRNKKREKLKNGTMKKMDLGHHPCNGAEQQQESSSSSSTRMLNTPLPTFRAHSFTGTTRHARQGHDFPVCRPHSPSLRFVLRLWRAGYSLDCTVLDMEGQREPDQTFHRCGDHADDELGRTREPVKPHTEGRTRSTHAVWPVTDASDRANVDMDEPADPDGLGEEVTDTVGMACVLAAPRTPTKTEREEQDVSHVPHRPWCRFCVMGRGLERRHLTQSGDRDDDRPRVCADYGYLSGDSTPLLVVKDRRTSMTFAAAVSMMGGGDPHAARFLAKRIDGLGCQEVTVRTDGEPSICELIRRVRELRAEGDDHCGRDESSAGNGIGERAILTVGGLVRTSKAVVEENVLELRDAGPRLTAWMVHHAAQVMCACIVGADGLTPIQAIIGTPVRHAAGGFR